LGSLTFQGVPNREPVLIATALITPKAAALSTLAPTNCGRPKDGHGPAPDVGRSRARKRRNPRLRANILARSGKSFPAATRLITPTTSPTKGKHQTQEPGIGTIITKFFGKAYNQDKLAFDHADLRFPEIEPYGAFIMTKYF